MAASARYAGRPAWLHEERSTSIGGMPSSVVTGGIGDGFLSDCTRVAKRDIPKEWLEVL